MARTDADPDGSMPATAQQRAEKANHVTINRALAVVDEAIADDRARGLVWLREHAEEFLDFEALEDQERSTG